MGFTLIGLGVVTPNAPVSGRYIPFGDSAYIDPGQTTEALAAAPMPVAGSFTGLTCGQGPITGTFNFGMRRNSASTTQNITQAVQGPLTTFDVYNVGDTIDGLWTGVTSATATRLQVVFKAASGHATFWVSPGGGATWAASTSYGLNITGVVGSTAFINIARVQNRSGSTGILQRFALGVVTNTTTASSTCGTNIAGSAGLNTVTVGAGLTGTFQDTTHSDYLTVGTLYCAQAVIGAGGSISPSFTSVGFVSVANSTDTISSGTLTVSAATSAYVCLYGSNQPTNANDAAADIVHGFPVALSQLTVLVFSNAATATSTATSRKNAAAGAQSASIGAGLTGFFTDTTHTDFLTPTDAANILISAGAGGALTFFGTMVTETIASQSFYSSGLALIGVQNPAATSPASSTFTSLLSGSALYALAFESTVPLPVAGTMSGLTAAQGAITSSFSATLRKNAANANETITDTAPTSSASDNFGTGDTFSLGWGTATGSVLRLQAIFQGWPYCASIYGATAQTTGAISANNTFNMAFIGYTGAFTTNFPGWDRKILSAGTLQGLSFVLFANATTTTTYVLLKINSVNGAQQVSIGAGLTGAFKDTTHSDSVNVGDLVRATYLPSLGNANPTALTIGFIPSAGPQTDLYTALSASLGAGSTVYVPMQGYPGNGITPESAGQITVGFPGTLSLLTGNVTSNATTGASGTQFRKNGVNSNQILSIGAGLTGYFADTTHTDSFSATDLICTRSTNGGGGTLGLATLGYSLSASLQSTNSPSYAYMGISNSAATPVAGNYLGFASPDSALSGGNASESAYAYPMPAAGTISGLSALLAPGPSSVGTWGLQLRKNNANAAQFISNLDLSDSVNIDQVVAGDRVNLQWASNTAGYTLQVQALYAPLDGTHWTNYCSCHAGGGVVLTAGTTAYLRLWGAPGSTIESFQQVRVNTPGTMSGYATTIIANSMSASFTIAPRKNGANATPTLTIGSGLTGLFQDTTNTFTVVSGDLICGSWSSASGTGSATAMMVGLAFHNTATAANDFFVTYGAALTAATYIAFSGSPANFTVESGAQIAMGFSSRMSLLGIDVTINPSTTASTYISRVNSANGTQTLTVGAGLTGWFQDVTHTDTLGPTSLINSLLTPGTGGLTFSYSTLTVSTVMNWAVSVSEAGAAADTVTGALTVRPTVAESGAAVDTVVSHAIYPSTITEAGSAVDTVTNSDVFPVQFISETGAAVDTVTSSSTYSPTIVETGSAVDTVTSSATLPSTIAEVGSAVDTVTSVAVYPSSITESGAAVDTVTLTEIEAVTIAEAGSAVDTVTSQATLPSTIVEVGAAVDTVSSFNAYTLTVAESGNAVDTVTSASVPISLISESGSAVDTVTSSGVFNVAVSEAGNAVDTFTTGAPVYQVSVVETGAAVDTVTSSAVFPVQIISETGAAVDTTTSVATFPSSIAESGVAVDNVTSTVVYLSTILETGSAEDTVTSTVASTSTIEESGDAVDTYTLLAQGQAIGHVVGSSEVVGTSIGNGSTIGHVNGVATVLGVSGAIVSAQGNIRGKSSVHGYLLLTPFPTAVPATAGWWRKIHTPPQAVGLPTSPSGEGGTPPVNVSY
jgi:hypothetical protein